ncbi:hypothetical protein EST38_g4605 [Candolleomyces aberdarensis]|uniref:Uncharacterized protein n=1 Tax=Candolleomyces aberdarensis TaxID=2316362 RepID=A0A4Q2DQI6_9AGAR|nr:hypothetical protein EST38_g4605 [Candolleomyces aberdarensis]
MPLKPGRYQIRYVPPGLTPPFAGGVYAVGEDLNKPVQALPNTPPFLGVRTWEVAHAPDGKDQYTIVTPGFKSPSIGIGPVLAGWGRPPRKDVDTEGLDPAAIAKAEIKADKEAEKEGILQWPNQPVLFTTTIQDWQITETRDGGGDPEKTTYNIKIPTEISGVISAVDVENGHLITKSYPIISTLYYRLPTWQFVPTDL